MSIQNRPNEIFLGKREYFDLLLSKELNEYNKMNDNAGRIHQKTFGVLFVVFIVFFGICVMGGLALFF